MTDNNYNYGGNYRPVNNRAPTPQQSFATSSAAGGDPYYGAQPSATPTRTYPNSDYQYQQYPQQASANNGGGYNWGVYSGGKTTPVTGMESLGNPSVPEQTQTPIASTKSNAHNSYDTSNLGNLAYASGLNYNSVAETVQSTSRYSGANAYEGSASGSVVKQNTPSQVHDRARPDSTGSRATPVGGTHSQRYAPEPAAGVKLGTAYNLPTPSPAYPQSLINSYPQRSTNTTMPSSGTPVPSRAPDMSSRNTPQSQYAPFTPPQPQKPARASKQEQTRQASNPPAAPIARSTANASSNAYTNQPRSQAARGPNNQSGKAIQNSPPPAATLPPAKMPTNMINRSGEGQVHITQNINSQPNQYQPATTSHLPPTSNYLPLPTQVSTSRSQQLPQPQRRPSPDRPTTVDPSHVYNSYHEYQKQIEAAEAEAARLAKLKEMAAVKERRRQEDLRAQQQRQKADMTAPAMQAAITLAHTMAKSNAAAESESESEVSDEDEQGQASGDVNEDDEDEQQITSASTSENTSHPTSVMPADPKGKGPSMLAQMAGPQEPPKDDTTVTMEEEMRRMVEKLRDYQSKDPKLFLQVWSSVRKTSTGQSPQAQAEGSQTQGSPVIQPAEASLRSPTPTTHQPAAAPKAATVVTEPVSAPAPPPTSKGKKATLQKSDNSESPSAQAKAGPKETVNAKRRVKRPSRSKAALAQRAAAEAAEAEALAATRPATTTTAQETTQVTPGKLGAVESQGNKKSTTDTPRVTPVAQPPPKASSSIATQVVVNDWPANTKPANTTQQTPAAPSQATDHAQRPSPAANPPPPQQGSTWPSDKRDAIAITASSVLNEIPENAGKKILARQIRDILEGNPSYIELCEMIEKLGFKMDRTRFAKTLLAVLPSNAKPKPQTPRPAVVTPTAGQIASPPSVPQSQAQAPQQNTPQPILPPAGVAARQTAILPPVTPGTTLAAPKSDGTPGSRTTHKNGMERRPRGRPRGDGLPPGSPYGRSRTGRGVARPRHDGQPVQSPYAQRVAERLENPVHLVPIVQQQPKEATATGTTTTADATVAAATAPPAQSPLPTSATTTSSDAGVQTQPGPPREPATTAPPDAPGLQSQSHIPPSSAMPNAPEQSNPPPASQGAGLSASLSTEEMHHMSLLRAYAGKPWQSATPASSQGGATEGYKSPYPIKVDPPPKGGWKTWREPETQTYPYPFRQNIPNPTVARADPGPVHYNPPYSTPTGPPQHGQFQRVAHPYHHHGEQLPPNVYEITSQSSVPRPSFYPAAPPTKEPPPKEPLTKEAQARKRTFAEIIDLTNGESSDKGEENSEKRQRVGDASAGDQRTNSLSAMHGPSPVHGPITGKVATRPTQSKPIPFQHYHQQPYANASSHNIVTNLSVNPQVKVTRNPLLEYDGIVKSIDRSLALRKSRYDPKTIARDVLISAGKHPAQRGLNAHLIQLKERFAKVNNTSDLSTFRWDIVDPGGAEVGSANMPPHNPKRHFNYPVSVTEASQQKYGPSRPSGLRNETSQAKDAIVIPDGNDDEDEDGDAAEPTLQAPKRRGGPPRGPNAASKPTPSKRVLSRNRRTPNARASTHQDEDDNDEDELNAPPPKRRGRGPAKIPERPHSRLGQPRIWRR
ncbi:hypothetical protein V493_02410 [Pseudogymnoascus sp. VKM F-4281 (FW-2241)]|nr:hypothetical protein V493_02410 [Pseudogymnoascus sp. VKM F-4281 (FW-2241)]